MGKPPCCDKLNVKRGLWSAEEDAKILAYVSMHGTGNWTALPKKAGLRRCGKSCRLRWTNYLRPDLKHDSFTPQEEELIVRLHAAIGSRWSIIAQQLPGRTDNDVKNYWNTKLRKKLSAMGIDPVTHKPFSQIFADYGNIGCLPKYGTRIGSLTKDLRNAFISKTEELPSPIQPAQGISNINHNNNNNTHCLVFSSKLEPIQECFLKNKIINNNNSSISDANNINNNSTDLLDQLQAIKLVAEASAHFFNEGSFASSSSSGSSSSCSSTSTCSISGEEKSSPSFSWQDFLLEDAFNIPIDDHHHIPQEQENVMESQSQEVIIPQEPQIEGMDLGIPTTSFVEALLDQENENFLDFPNLLEEPFFY